MKKRVGSIGNLSEDEKQTDQAEEFGCYAFHRHLFVRLWYEKTGMTPALFKLS
jgi:hypothetical protein